MTKCPGTKQAVVIKTVGNRTYGYCASCNRAFTKGAEPTAQTVAPLHYTGTWAYGDRTASRAV